MRKEFWTCRQKALFAFVFLGMAGFVLAAFLKGQSAPPEAWLALSGTLFQTFMVLLAALVAAQVSFWTSKNGAPPDNSAPPENKDAA